MTRKLLLFFFSCLSISPLLATDDIATQRMKIANQCDADPLVSGYMKESFDKESPRVINDLILCYLVWNDNEKDDEGNTPLMRAILDKRCGQTYLLLDHLKNANEVEKRIYLDSRNDESQTCLMLAANHADEKVVAQLCEYGANVNATRNDGERAVSIAVSSEKKALGKVKILRKYKADIHIVNRKKESPLLLATQKGDAPMVAYLLEEYREYSKKLNNDRYKKVKVTIEKEDGNLEQCTIPDRWLDTWVNLQNTHSETALMIACKNGNVAIVKELLRYKAELDIKNKDSEDALMYGVKYRQHSVVKVLLSQKYIDTYKRNNKKQTPLMVAILNRDLLMVRQLLSHWYTSYVSYYKDKNGDTALMYAVKSGDVDIVKAVLEPLTSYRLKEENNNDQTALDIARSLEDRKITFLLWRRMHLRNLLILIMSLLQAAIGIGIAIYYPRLHNVQKRKSHKLKKKSNSRKKQKEKGKTEKVKSTNSPTQTAMSVSPQKNKRTNVSNYAEEEVRTLLCTY